MDLRDLIDQVRGANRAAVAERERRRAFRAWERLRRSGPAASLPPPPPTPGLGPPPGAGGGPGGAGGGPGGAGGGPGGAGGGPGGVPDPGAGGAAGGLSPDEAATLASRPDPAWRSALTPAGIAFAILLALLVLWPLGLPGFDLSRFLEVQRILWAAMIVTGLNLVAGYAGQLSLGQKIFVLCGGYTVGVMTTRFGGVFGDPWVALLAAVLIGLAVGALLGLPALRVRGAYLAIVTLAFVPIFFRIFASETFEGIFNATRGIADVATTLGDPARPPARLITWPFSDRPVTDIDFYLFTVLAFGIVVLFARNVVVSRWGRAMMAVRESEIAAKSSGVRVYRVKVTAFMISAAFAAFAGALTTYNFAFISPEPPAAVHIRDSFVFVVMMIVGGTGTLAGPIVGATSVTLIQVLLRGSEVLLRWQTSILGLLALLTVITAPTGVVGMLRHTADRAAARFRGTRPAPVAAPPALPDPLVRPRPRPAEPGVGDLVLEAREMSKIFGGLRANDRISLGVRRGTIHSLIGPNGSGKTTFINVVTGVYQPEEGEVWFAGERIDGVAAFVTVERGMGRTFQNLQLWRRMTVLQNVMVGLHVRARSGFLAAMLRTPRARREEAQIRARAMGLLQFVGLAAYADTPAGTLPYGPQRYLEIARALALDPTLLILDEPAAGLNPAEIGDLMALIRRIRETGITVFLIEHHMDLVMGVSDRVSVLDYGRKIAEGTPAEVQADQRVIEAYLGTEMAEAGAH